MVQFLYTNPKLLLADLAVIKDLLRIETAYPKKSQKMVIRNKEFELNLN